LSSIRLTTVKKEMRRTRKDYATVVPYSIISEKHSKERIYKFLRFSLSQTSNVARKKIINKILDRERSVGIIEWWTGGSIVHKPKSEFQAILISEI